MGGREGASEPFGASGQVGARDPLACEGELLTRNKTHATT
jgi:hypothetical protein